MSRLPPPVPEEYAQDPIAYASSNRSNATFTINRPPPPSGPPPPAQEVSSFPAKPMPPPGSPTAADLAAAQHLPKHSFGGSTARDTALPAIAPSSTAPFPRSKKTDLNDLEPEPSRLANNICVRQVRKARAGIVACQKSNHACQRALVCAVAVAMLWLTSLGLCQAIVHYAIRVPDIGEVIRATEKSINITESQKLAYEACAERNLLDCEHDILKLQGLAIENMTVIQHHNEQLLQNLEQFKSMCELELQNGIDTINYIQTVLGGDPNSPAYQTAIYDTDARCAFIAATLEGENGGLIALGASSRFSDDTEMHATATLSAYEARASYNEQYFANKTAQYGLQTNKTLREAVKDTAAYFGNLNKTYDQYMACMSQTNTFNGETCDEESVMYKFAQMQTEAQGRVNDAKAQVSVWANKANQTISQMAKFYNALRNNPQLLSAFDVLLAFNGMSLESLGFNMISGVTIGGVTLGSISTINLSALMSQYTAQTQAYLASVANQQAASARANADLILAQANMPLSHPFPGYNPPPVNTTNQREEMQNLTGPFVNTMGAALTGTAVAAGNAVDYVANANVSNVNENSGKEFLSSLQTRVFGFFVYEGFSPEQFAESWEELSNTCLQFDYIFRIVYTIQLIIKYWRVSAIDTPPADVRTDLMQDKGLAVDTRSPLAKLGAFLAHPATQVLVMFVFFAVLGSIFLGMYLPLYNNFVDGCVMQGFLGSGSMVSRNVYSISYNYASSRGDQLTTVNVDRLNIQREVNCTREVDASVRVQQMFETKYTHLFQSHRDNQYEANAIASCLNIPLLQQDYPDAAYEATQHNATTLDLPGLHCAAEVPKLRDSVYVCPKQVCDGKVCHNSVNVETLSSMTWTASCLVEEYMHTTFLTSAMIVIVFVLINVSRVFLMRGLVRMYWRFLTDGRFTYLGTCERNGELRYPSLITVEGYSMRRAIHESLKVRLFYWEAKSWSIFVFGAVLNVPWLVILFVLQSHTRSGTY